MEKSGFPFIPGSNCWQISQAHHATPLIDCANFYRAVHRAIVKSKQSIFVLGWEIDSQQRLLRGNEERNSEIPSVFVNLLDWKARTCPEINIYLCRWDGTIVFVRDRDLMPEYVWASQTPENVHICVDTKVPMGGSHHQKIILVDDELVFTGGMDIARQRWDERTHRVQEPERTDFKGSYGPYHDTQIVMDGPITHLFAKIARERWFNATGYHAIPIRQTDRNADRLAEQWPEHFPPLMNRFKVAVSRTLPRIEDQEPVQEIKQQYVDLISIAENFIYIENQFLTSEEIAYALNKRLKEKPALKVLVISSYAPQGIWERESLWAGRIDFKKIVEKDLGPDRFKLTCTVITDAEGKNHYKRIHSKVMVIDDRFLTIASSNLNHRSLVLDTECDVTFIAENQDQRDIISFVRNDLIAEHTGRTAEQIKRILSKKFSLKQIMNVHSSDSYRLKEIDDTKFTDKSLQTIANLFADPKSPLMSYVSLFDSSPKLEPFRNPRKHRLAISIVLIFLGFYLLSLIRHNLDWFSPDRVQEFLVYARSSPFSLPLVCLIYIVGGLVLFPVTLISLMTAAVFGALLGPIYCMAGALSSGALMFWIGNLAGLKGLRRLFGDRIRAIDNKFNKAGVFGMAAIRFLPVAPYTLVNLAAGISSIRFFDFMMGTFLGFLPGFIVKGFVGDSLVQILIEPKPKTLFYLILGLMLWIALIAASYQFAKKMQRRHQNI